MDSDIKKLQKIAHDEGVLRGLSLAFFACNDVDAFCGGHGEPSMPGHRAYQDAIWKVIKEKSEEYAINKRPTNLPV